MKKIILPLLLLTALFGQTIDADKSYVKFKVRNMGVRDVTGTITGMQGAFKFDSAEPDSANFDVTVNVNTINMTMTTLTFLINTLSVCSSTLHL